MLKNICRSSNIVRHSTQGIGSSSPSQSSSNSSGLRFSVAQHLRSIHTSRCNSGILLPSSSGTSTFATTSPAALRRSKSQTHFTLLKPLAAPRLRTMSTGSTPSSDTNVPKEETSATGQAAGVADAPVSTPKHTNRLAKEKSPYLLQHAHNPVDWYPWGDEAIEKAKRENKLIFLSVGYSTCHWCHVMEHESFENEEIAALMNEHYVNIKVDREERPDIDRIYMQFLLMISGSGGWPMNVWLAPDLTPITAGTYFAPDDKWGRPAFSTILKFIANKWPAQEEELKNAGSEVLRLIKMSSSLPSDGTPDSGSTEDKLQEALKLYETRYDTEFGGLGSSPKFPEIPRINFLFHAYIATKNADILNMALDTLHYIGKGGIHDHVFGGFARYSVDRRWHVPHFEKMLYDQGQLMAAYANAYKLTGDKKFHEYADGIFRYITTDLQHPAGGFYAGEDADSLPTAKDSIKVEGAFYAWTYDEIKQALNDNAEKYKHLEIDADKILTIYSEYYDLKPEGNVEQTSDPHGHLTGKNILFVGHTPEEICEKYSIAQDQLTSITKISNEILYEIRRQRPRPHLDTKIICSWNGLVLSGLSKLANCGGPKRDEYIKAAEKLMKFMHQHFYVKETKLLKRTCYGVATNDETLQELLEDEQIDGFLDDHAFLVRGLLDYYKATLDNFALEWAKELQDIQDSSFWDASDGAYFYSKASARNVVLRLKEDQDGAEPCGNSVSARNLLLLSHYMDEKAYSERAAKLFEFFSDQKPFGYALPEMMSALMLQENGLDLVAVVGPDSDNTMRFVEICRKYYIPGMIIVHVNPQDEEHAYNQRVQKKFKMINDQTTVYICHNRVCRMPVTDPEKLEQTLTENFFHKP